MTKRNVVIITEGESDFITLHCKGGSAESASEVCNNLYHDLPKVCVCDKPSTTNNRGSRRSARRKRLQTANPLRSDDGSGARSRRSIRMSDNFRRINSYIKHSTVPSLRNKCIFINMNRKAIYK